MDFNRDSVGLLLWHEGAATTITICKERIRFTMPDNIKETHFHFNIRCVIRIPEMEHTAWDEWYLKLRQLVREAPDGELDINYSAKTPKIRKP